MCLSGITVKNKTTGQLMTVPCGQCMPCKISKQSKFASKYQMQTKYSKNNFWVCLTFNDLYLDSINPKDWKRITTLFKKRINQEESRKYNNPKFKDMLNMEYGSENGRPHFHETIWNYHSDDIEILRENLERLWPYGNVWIEPLPRNCKTIANYIGKHYVHIGDDKGDIHGYGIPPFRSRPKDLGTSEYVKRMKGYHQSDIDRNYMPDPSGGNKKLPLPVEYRKALYTEEQRKIQRIRFILNSDKAWNKLTEEEKHFQTTDVYEKEERKRRRRETMKQLFSNK